jgi:hypothetical protein
MAAGSAVYACARNFNWQLRALEAPASKIILDTLITVAVPFAVSFILFSLPKIFKNVKISGDKDKIHLAFWLWVVGIILRVVNDAAKAFGVEL